MGSTGALFHNPNLNSDTLCLKCSNSNTHARTILRVNQTNPKLPGFSNKNGFKKFRRIVAVEDVTDKQREINGGSLNGAGPAAEDRLGTFSVTYIALLIPSPALDRIYECYSSDGASENPFLNNESDDGGNSIYNFLYPSKELLPDDQEMSIYDHLEELRERIFVSVLAVGAAMVGIRILWSSVRSPVILYEIIAFILPGLTKAERRFLGPIVLGSSILFYTGNIYVNVHNFLLVMTIEGINEVPVVQLLLGQLGLVSSEQMLSIWRYVVVGSVIAAAILTPSTDPLTQMLLAGPLMGLYLGGASVVKLLGR
ncbi:hypothetical protein DH2020_043934 [Rehmannia glutinosa]|uniref:Uncharacterized protein n=1 Tax=Rehmannia glutinosa TaxID=99300 RepID=A0ABR0UI98_REHGL